MAVFWVVAPCSLVEVYQRFRGPCPHHQGNHRPLQPRRQPSKTLFLTSWTRISLQKLILV
jgi:hypothetical protein